MNPYTPGDLWREISHYGSTPATAQAFVQDHGEKLYRRSLYTFWKRTAPPPNMVAFDAPNRETCVVARPATTTPLQALVLLNDVQFVEAVAGVCRADARHSKAATSDRRPLAVGVCRMRVSPAVGAGTASAQRGAWRASGTLRGQRGLARGLSGGRRVAARRAAFPSRSTRPGRRWPRCCSTSAKR